MNKEIEEWKEKTKSVFHIIEYKKFWSYIETLQKTNEQYEITYKKIEAQDKIINTQALEIARLKDERDWWKDRFFGQQEYDDSHRITAIEYKKRIDKAIEYIKKNYYEIVYKTKGTMENDLLEILGDKE